MILFIITIYFIEYPYRNEIYHKVICQNINNEVMCRIITDEKIQSDDKKYICNYKYYKKVDFDQGYFYKEISKKEYIPNNPNYIVIENNKFYKLETINKKI